MSIEIKGVNGLGSYQPLRHLSRSLGSRRPQVLERPVLRVFRFDEPLSGGTVHIHCRAM